MPRTIPFTKMHGLGNDYIYVNTMLHPIDHPSRVAMLWSDRHTGIGGDGLVLIGSSQAADFSMRIFNADGSEAMMCGNASRCIGKYVYDKGLTDKTDLTLETLSGIRHLSLHVEDGEVTTVTVDMGIPVFRNAVQVAAPDNSLREYGFEIDGQTLPGTYVCMGNPHLVIFTADAEQVPLGQLGPQLENHPFFPQRTNVEFASFRPDGSIRMRVWERGSGITRACGTGACATAVAAIATHHTGQRLIGIHMDGGNLDVRWDKTDSHVYMTGTASLAFEGTVTL